MFGKKVTSKHAETATAIDIGSFAVKIIQVTRQESLYSIDAFGYSKIMGSTPEASLEALHRALNDAKLSHKKINTAISPDGVIVRFIILPEMSSDDLKKAMSFELERYVPFEKKDVISDYMILKERPDNKNMKVLLVAAKKDYVTNRVQLLKDVGLEADIVTIETLILNNIFQVNYPEKINKTIGIINIGARTSNICICRGDTSYFMRDIQLGGESITHLLKEKLDVDLIEAEKIKCQLKNDDGEKLKIIEPIFGNLLNEIYLSFDYFESEFGVFVEEVYVSGGSAKLPVLLSFFKEHLNREVALLNTIKGFQFSPSIVRQSIEDQASSVAVVLGLALESFCEP